MEGYCATTEYNTGACLRDTKGSFPWPADVGTRSTEWHLQACIASCMACARCNFVSFSRGERDCSWYRDCDMGALNNDLAFTKHKTWKVRDADGSVAAAARAILSRREPVASEPFRKPRLIDVLVYAGAHYDEVLQVRMHELDLLVDLFLILEIPRRPSAAGPPARGPILSSQPWLAPFANRTRIVEFSGGAVHAAHGAELPGGHVHAFLDLDLQTLGDRELVLNSMQRAFAEVAQPNDLVLISDIDEIPRRAALASLLADTPKVTSLLSDGLTILLTGPSFMYHWRCRVAPDAPPWSVGPRLCSGETLRHFGGGGVRYFAKAGSPRQPALAIPNASWHLRYFMAAREIQGVLCDHSEPDSLVDALEWWRRDLNVSAMCSQPALIHRAISQCTDLWGRHEISEHHTYIRSGEWKSVEDGDETLPYHVASHPEMYHSSKLNRLHELTSA